MMPTFRHALLATTFVAASCGNSTHPTGTAASPAEEATEPAESAEIPAPEPEASPIDGAALAAEWRPEVIPLPQAWAPELPSGTEVLRFAPGMFEEGAEDYWTYAFRIDLDEELAGQAAIASFLELYYDGLLGSVGKGRGFDMGDDPAQVQVGALEDGVHPIRIELIDGFVTGKPLTLHMEWRPEGKTARIIASPQPKTHGIWNQLRAVVGVLEPGA